MARVFSNDIAFSSILLQSTVRSGANAPRSSPNGSARHAAGEAAAAQQAPNARGASDSAAGAPPTAALHGMGLASGGALDANGALEGSGQGQGQSGPSLNGQPFGGSSAPLGSAGGGAAFQPFRVGEGAQERSWCMRCRRSRPAAEFLRVAGVDGVIIRAAWCRTCEDDYLAAVVGRQVCLSAWCRLRTGVLKRNFRVGVLRIAVILRHAWNDILSHRVLCLD
jgi:hypothetical protein